MMVPRFDNKEAVDKRYKIKLLSIKNEKKAERLNEIEEARKRKLLNLIIKDARWAKGRPEKVLES